MIFFTSDLSRKSAFQMMQTSLDFNYVKPCLDLLKFKLQLLTLGLGVLMT